jgi:DNA-binding NarL/FixJ family response regulator
MRIVVVSGEPAFRLGVRVILDAAADLKLAADAPDARSGFTAIDAEKPDVVMIDVALQGMNGIDATREVKRRSPKTRVLLLASWARERDALDGFGAGADGYALKTESVEALRDAIRTVAGGRRYITPELRGVTIDRDGIAPSEQTDVLHVLSLREREVLDLVVKGCRSRDIARELCISIKTVETHRNHINRKLGCASAADLTRFAADNGLLRSGPASGARPQERTTVLVMDDGSDWRARLLRIAQERGYQIGRITSAPRALGELRHAPLPGILMIDDSPSALSDPGPVRAVASLPDAEAEEWFSAVLDTSSATENGAHATVVSLSSTA